MEDCEEFLQILKRINFAISDVDLDAMKITISEAKYHSYYNYRLDKNSKSFENEILKYIAPDYFVLNTKLEYNGYRTYIYKVDKKFTNSISLIV